MPMPMMPRKKMPAPPKVATLPPPGIPPSRTHTLKKQITEVKKKGQKRALGIGG